MSDIIKDHVNLFDSTYFAIFFYSVCSGSLLVVNKVAISLYPFPSIVMLFQLSFCIGFLLFGKKMNILNFDDFNFSKSKLFIPYVISFSLSIFFNVKALHASNVETVIVFRCSSPITVSILDYLFLGRSFPNIRSILSMLGIFIFAIAYMNYSSRDQYGQLSMSAYFYLFAYYLMITFEMTYGKVLMNRVNFEHKIWGSVYYTNLLSLPLIVFICLTSGEIGEFVNYLNMPFVKLNETLSLVSGPIISPIILLISAIVGVAIGWAGFNCRNKTSATLFTVVGATNKLLSILFTLMIWSDRAKFESILCLILCILSSSLYQQSPLRGTVVELSNQEQTNAESIGRGVEDKELE